jgi:tetratricopeptide (TPR) repeat protein
MAGAADLAILYAEAVALHRSGQMDAAEAAYRRILAAAPDQVDARHLLGVIALQRGRLDEAAAEARRALALRPDHAAAHCTLAIASAQLGRQAEAEASFERAVLLQPHYIEALQGFGTLRQRQGRLEAAASLYEQALALAPDRAQCWYGLGGTRHWQNRLDEAQRCYERAIGLAPGQAELHSNLALVLKDRGELAAALAELDRALALAPDLASARFNKGLLSLLNGDFATGWRDFEARWQMPRLDSDRRAFSCPRWAGEVGSGGTLLLWAEQGLGDVLQFCRYATLAAERGWQVVLDVPPSLTRVLHSLGGVRIVATGEADPAEIERHCPLLSLPLLFQTRLNTIPAAIPYLAADQADIAAWRERVTTRRELMVGIAWAGNPGEPSPLHQALDRRRSIALAQLAPLFAVPGTRFVSLQKQRRPGDDPAAHGLIDVMDDIRDFADTAALIMNLDLVISVDTAVAHLAGALGKQVWLLNRFDTCWRWLMDRDDSPWYPSLRQFRQQSPGDWAPVVAQARAALAALAASRG